MAFAGLPLLLVSLLCLAGSQATAATLQVPAEFDTIQDGIDAAADGDVVLVAPGTYVESLDLADKSVTLASHFFTTGDPAFIAQTVIDGGNASYAIYVQETAGPDTTIVGFTIQNANDGITAKGHFQLLNSRITATTDGIDYERGGGGLVRNCLFDGNDDDGIDLDKTVAVVIEDSEITGNDGDGIEIRLQDYQGPTLEVVIRNNRIAGNLSDGIQLISYEVPTDRVFHIEHNLFVDNAQAAIGMMCCEQTNEDFQGASLPERVYVIHNTFVGNDHGIAGGDNDIILNNLFVDTTNIALKRVSTDRRSPPSTASGRTAATSPSRTWTARRPSTRTRCLAPRWSSSRGAPPSTPAPPSTSTWARSYWTSLRANTPAPHRTWVR